ncbi:MAG: aspartate-alanine antiporter [Candidatus Amulumruptor caecigallinarius]|nr:aspartate-alanine antiporter [Candidatus Amulumruptor caecigallinarius]MCM1396268.1 aspartate-alanine antiporter [Candidatus Amulumruptor caecigallinarius]MCM1454262.1 aspartate-alanine antiporter [bacterium]
MEWLTEIFRANPVIPIFLTIGLGFWLGNLRFKTFSLGPVTATLIVGVIIGQLDIPMSETLKSVAFMLFLFAIGYSVGPQFFRSLKGDGLKQIGFALVEVVLCIATVVVVCLVMGYNKGMAVGLFSGSQAFSAVIGVGTGTIRSLGLPPETQKAYLDIIPACYAVCYVFGTIGSAWVIANLGPRLLGGLAKVREQTARLEEEMDTGDTDPGPGTFVANRPISFRAYRAESDYFFRPRTVREIEQHIASLGLRHFIERLRINGEVMDPQPELKVRKGDILVISGRRESVIDDAGWIGSEVTDHELLNFEAENLPVTVAKSGASGLTLGELRKQDYMRGVMVRKLVRDEVPIPMRARTRLHAGDVVTLVGLPQDVAAAVSEIGYPDRPTEVTDMVFTGLGIAIGCLIGAITIYFKGIPISLSTSGGTILAGLVLGWWRSRRPTFGRIPAPVLWFMNNLGLNLFIAVVGLAAGPTFISGLHQAGLEIFLAGVVCTTVPLVLSIIIGSRLFHFPAAVTLGCVAGSRNAVAALGAIQDNLESTLPAMSYTVTYAVGSITLIFAGMIVPLIV